MNTNQEMPNHPNSEHLFAPINKVLRMRSFEKLDAEWKRRQNALGYRQISMNAIGLEDRGCPCVDCCRLRDECGKIKERWTRLRTKEANQ